MTKIYDCFTFFNELDLLELRFEELYDHVDYFVLVESDHTFTNIPKPLHFKQNIKRFSKFLDKVKYVKIKSLCDSNPWKNEEYQRNCISLGIKNADPNDIIIISDVDEIPRPSVIQEIRQSKDDISGLHIPFFYFKFNFISINSDLYLYIVVTSKKHLVDKHGAHFFRSLREHFKNPNYQFENYSCKTYDHAGWHFTYLGDTEFVKQKFVSFSHAYDDGVSESVDKFQLNDELVEGNKYRYFVKIDEYFPKTVLKNLQKYEKYIMPGAEKVVSDYFPLLKNNPV